MAKQLYLGIPAVVLYNNVHNGALRVITNEYIHGWDMSSYYTITHPDDVLTIKLTDNHSSTTGTYGNIQTFNSSFSGSGGEKKILYMQAKVKGASTNTGYPRVFYRYRMDGSTTDSYGNLSSIDGLTGTELNDGNWHTLSCAITTDNGTHTYEYFDIRFGIQPSSTKNDIMNIKEVLVVELTRSFHHNYPSKTWCDNNITFFDFEKTYLDTWSYEPTSVAIPINKMYVGVNNKARKVKKAYIGINNIARLWYGNKNLSYYGTTTTLQSARSGVAGGSIGNYAVFTGGYDGSSYTLLTESYDSTLIRTILSNATGTHSYNESMHTKDYLIFAGGATSSSGVNKVDAYNNLLIKPSIETLTTSRGHAAATSIEGYGLIGGGENSSDGAINSVEVYDNSLIKTTTPSNLYYAGTDITATSINNYAIFHPGYHTSGGTVTSRFNIYDTSLVRIATPLQMSGASKSIYYTPSASNRNYAFFAGGIYSNNEVIVFNKELIFSILPDLLPATFREGAGIGIDDYVMFAGGTSTEPYVVVYNDSLVRQNLDNLGGSTKIRYSIGTAVAGNYLLFAGGFGSSTRYSTVNVYQVS